MQEGVKFTIAPLWMPSNMAIAPVCEEAKILRMKPSGMGAGRVGSQDLSGINHVIIRPTMYSRIINGKVEFEFVEQ
jgi:hypothetical protein